MQQLNLGLAGYGIALAIHRLGDSVTFSWLLVGFFLIAAAVVMVKLESSKKAIANQLDLLLTVVLSLFGGVMAWL